MGRLRAFDKDFKFKKSKSQREVWVLLCALILVVTIVVFRSYAKYEFSTSDILFTNSSVGEYYYEELLNGADPVLTSNLVPVTISDDGSVYKADLDNEWYKYEDKRWANAVVLKDPIEVIGQNNIYGGVVIDKGVHLDGIDDYIDIGFANYDFTNKFSLAITFKIDKVNVGKNTVIVGNWEGAGGGIYYYDNNIYGELYIEELNDYISVIVPISDVEKFHNVVLTYDGNSIIVYIDGEKESSCDVEGNIKSSTMPFYIGGNPTTGGMVDKISAVTIKDYAIYNRTLDDSEIVDIMNNNIIITDDTDLLCYVNFDNSYTNNEKIPESNIESYFVWVPKYSYQLWDLGNYSSETGLDTTKKHAIPIRFGTTNTGDGVIGECATPGIAGSSGNCSVGDYMTHPAFLAFDTNGLWVAKFKVGYDGATSSIMTTDTDISKVLIKPNTYFWKADKQKYIFKTSYNYLREDESHMMKNTEWGAVAYLSHSLYGTCTVDGCDEIRLNNNTASISGYSATLQPTKSWSTDSIEGNSYESTDLGVDGTYTINYFNPASDISSTTLNYYGIYDMSGGWWEFVMGYTNGASTVGGTSEITTEYDDFFTNSKWNKYYDLYTNTLNTEFNNRILGDATGEMGPFGSVMASWNNDKVAFMKSSNPWINRGGNAKDGYWTGLFSFNPHFDGGSTFRIVLAPK